MIHFRRNLKPDQFQYGTQGEGRGEIDWLCSSPGLIPQSPCLENFDPTVSAHHNEGWMTQQLLRHHQSREQLVHPFCSQRLAKTIEWVHIEKTLSHSLPQHKGTRRRCPIYQDAISERSRAESKLDKTAHFLVSPSQNRLL